MRYLRRLSAGGLAGIVVAWIACWLVIPPVATLATTWHQSRNGSGGVAMIGVGVSTAGMLLILAPPLVLVACWIAARRAGEGARG